MSVVLNVLKFISLFVFGIAYFIGLGWLIIGPLLHGKWIVKKKERSLLHETPLLMMSGLIINFGIVLCLQSLNLSLFFGGVFSLVGFILFIIPLLRQSPKRYFPSETRFQWLGIAIICLVTIGPILTEPLYRWDARSFWFFHAKMIYYAGSIGPSAGWMHPAVTFSHLDYPILVPAIAAQITHVMGFWNEYLPKASLFLMYIPAIIWLFTFVRRSFSSIILILLIPFSFYPWLWNGYMDGLLAVYFAISMLLFSRFLRTSQPIDLISTFCCLFTIINIKNEGSFGFVAAGCAIILIIIIGKRRWAVKKTFTGKYLAAGLIAAIPYIVWAIYRWQWNLYNDLQIGTLASFTRLLTRLSDGSIKLILLNIFEQLNVSFMLLGLLFFVMFLWNRRFENHFFPAFIAAIVYCAGMVVIYLITPADLQWHLDTSVERIMLTVNGLLFVGSYIIFDSLEDHLLKSGMTVRSVDLK